MLPDSPKAGPDCLVSILPKLEVSGWNPISQLSIFRTAFCDGSITLKYNVIKSETFGAGNANYSTYSTNTWGVHGMKYPQNGLKKLFVLSSMILLLFGWPSGARASDDVEYTNLNVHVTDAKTGEPLKAARLTLQFVRPREGFLSRSKKVSFSGKTDSQGHYKFANVPKGQFRLIVTAEEHQTYGKNMILERDNQLFEIKLRVPQPLE